MRLCFTIHGGPRTKKNHSRVVFFGARCSTCNRGSLPRVLPSEAHKVWFALALPQAHAVRARVLPATIERPVNVAAVVYRDAARGDALGYYQALADLLQAAGIVSDDQLCVTWDGSRLRKDSVRPRIEVTITEAAFDADAKPQRAFALAEVR